MLLPDLLLEWSDKRAETWHKSVMIVFPTQYGAQNINTSFIIFRGTNAEELRLVTGVDKDDQFWEYYTRIQIATYGMIWQWLVKSGPSVVSRLFAQTSCFLLDEFSGVAELGGHDELKADPQLPEIARLLARKVEENSDSYRLVVTGAALDRHFVV